MRIVLVLPLLLSLVVCPARADDAAARRDSAKSQFERAENSRVELESRPEAARTIKEYISLVSSYRRVYLITPHAAEVPTALNHVAALQQTMGDLFDTKYYQQAVDSLQFLLREYPANRYREDAMLAIARIEQDDLQDPVLAQKSYEQFLALHPKSSHRVEVRAALDKLGAGSGDAPKTAAATSVPKERTPAPIPETIPAKASGVAKTPATTDTRQGSVEILPAPGSRPEVTRIRTWNAATYTRIVIDVGAQVKYQAARIDGPDRIYFDIENAKIGSVLLHKSIEVGNDGFLKGVRVAQNQAGVVRVVLEVNHVKDYSVFLLPDPYRLIIDVYGTSTAVENTLRASTALPDAVPTDALVRKAAVPTRQTVAQSSNQTLNNAAVQTPETTLETATETTLGKASEKSPAKLIAPSPKNAVVAKVGNDKEIRTAVVSTPALSTSKGTDFPLLIPEPVASKKAAPTAKSAHEQAEEIGPPSMPEPNRAGQHSLSRALGLKVGRIVIDAGHGGHDTGTIGPTGLMEKDLCLDIALRVGKLVRARLPSAEVVFTREDDSFIPLEQRTSIANDARADLFLSIHANSSSDRKARGIETYYLNFTGSNDAMEVAARENSLSENSVHDLQDIVKKIARNEKIEESRDLAGNIQESLAQRMENAHRGERNRGVRKAPFVVLIGADMPSVLSEISFISNPADEQWLKKPENRQRVAEGLFRGIETYLHSTNSLAVNLDSPEARNR